jgi:hypothetical protein
MNIKCPGNQHRYFIASFFSLFFISGVSAHGELIWNDFTIDNKNDSIAAAIGQVRKEVADIILGRREARDWPDRELSRLKDELAHYLEEHEALLNYFKEQKVHLNSSRQVMENPRAGRSMVASQPPLKKTCISGAKVPICLTSWIPIQTRWICMLNSQR